MCNMSMRMGSTWAHRGTHGHGHGHTWANMHMHMLHMCMCMQMQMHMLHMCMCMQMQMHMGTHGHTWAHMGTHGHGHGHTWAGRTGVGSSSESSAPCSPRRTHRASLSEQDMQQVRSPRPGLVRTRPSLHASPPPAASSAHSAAAAGRAPVRWASMSASSRWRFGPAGASVSGEPMGSPSASASKRAASPHGGCELYMCRLMPGRSTYPPLSAATKTDSSGRVAVSSSWSRK